MNFQIWAALNDICMAIAHDMQTKLSGVIKLNYIKQNYS